MDVSAQLDEVLAEIRDNDLAAKIALEAGLDADEAETEMEIYLSEASVAQQLVEAHLVPGQRVLEVGGGIGLFARVLQQAGVDITDLEPLGEGFDFIGFARRAVRGESPPPEISHGVEVLDPEIHGRFDLVYSVNVLEHVEDWELALDRIHDCLTPTGTAVLTCPNYTFPYEPHFGVPLVPGRPSLTERVLPDRMTETGLWRSLNWVTARGVQRWADRAGADVEFSRGMLADAVARLDSDDEFRARHRHIARLSGVAANRLVDRTLRALPPSLMTPMTFVVRRR